MNNASKMLSLIAISIFSGIGLLGDTSMRTSPLLVEGGQVVDSLDQSIDVCETGDQYFTLSPHTNTMPASLDRVQL